MTTSPSPKLGADLGAHKCYRNPIFASDTPASTRRNFDDVQPRAELWAAARLARVRKPVIRYTDGPGLVATSEVRAPGGPFIIALGASPRRAGDLVTQLASKS